VDGGTNAETIGRIPAAIKKSFMVWLGLIQFGQDFCSSVSKNELEKGL
jgi:hypothetical protein